MLTAGTMWRMTDQAKAVTLWQGTNSLMSSLLDSLLGPASAVLSLTVHSGMSRSSSQVTCPLQCPAACTASNQLFSSFHVGHFFKSLLPGRGRNRAAVIGQTCHGGGRNMEHEISFILCKVCQA